MFDFDHEKKIHDLMHKFGLTRREADGFLNESEDRFGLKQLWDDKKLRGILILLAILFGLIIIIWLYNKLTKKK
jgi:Trk-type K+ transport system membrane component